MNYIVLDLEWNQSNAGKEAENPELTFEIIEIGAVKLNEEFHLLSEFSKLIKPQIYHEMHHITSKLIHMRMEELERGKPFVQVMQSFLEWIGEEECTFCTWGPLDLTELQKNMRYYGMGALSDGPIAFLDVQKLFSIAFEDRKTRRALEWAVDYLGIEKDIPFHRAFSDAYYTAKVLEKIEDKSVLAYVSFDTFTPPGSRDREVKIQFETYAKYISREFADKAEAFADKEVTSSKCYLCHRNLRKKVKWFTANGKNYYCIAYCDKHGYLKGKSRVRRTENGGVFIVKTTKFISEQDVEVILKKKAHAQEMRKRKNKR
ncbi:MAG: exonuclease domain-containing protein [Lachnospiraceae bacterium]|nr:exonuclease domain-containing protein [Lachnospiraceae bacterium]